MGDAKLEITTTATELETARLTPWASPCPRSPDGARLIPGVAITGGQKARTFLAIQMTRNALVGRLAAFQRPHPKSNTRTANTMAAIIPPRARASRTGTEAVL